jgi:uncharacterized protein with FMN-binding domain
MKKKGRVFIIILACLLAIFAVVFFYVRRTSAWVKSITWGEPELSSVADGDYTGESHLVLPVGTAAANAYFKVTVHVGGHRYRSIDVVAPAEGAGVAKGIAQRVIDAQSVHPDAVSGATVTNTAFLTAVDDALGRGGGQ